MIRLVRIPVAYGNSLGLLAVNQMTTTIVFILIAGGLIAAAAFFIAVITGVRRNPKSSPPSKKGFRTPHIEVKKSAPIKIEIEEDNSLKNIPEVQEAIEPPDRLEEFNLLTRDQLSANEYHRIVKMAESCPRPPTLLHDVMNQLSIGSYDVRKFSELAHRDAILASQLLRTVNSAFFGMKNEVTSVQRAVVLLGFNNVKDIALKLALDKVFSSGIAGIKEAYSKFWIASFAASSVCGLAARALDLEKGSELSTGALLSYLGNFAFIANYQDYSAQYVEQDSLLNRVEFEQETAGANSAIIGSILAEAWTLPITVKSCIEASLIPISIPADECSEEIRTQAGICYACARIGDYFAFNSLRSFENFDFNMLNGPEHFYIKSYVNEGELKGFSGLFSNK